MEKIETKWTSTLGEECVLRCERGDLSDQSWAMMKNQFFKTVRQNIDDPSLEKKWMASVTTAGKELKRPLGV